MWAIDANIYMHGGFENETPNIPTNTIMKLDLLALCAKVPTLVTKLEQSIGSGVRKNKSAGGQGAAGSNSDMSGDEASRGGANKTVSALVKENLSIKMVEATIESKPGSGVTVQKALGRHIDDKKIGNN